MGVYVGVIVGVDVAVGVGVYVGAGVNVGTPTGTIVHSVCVVAGPALAAAKVVCIWQTPTWIAVISSCTIRTIPGAIGLLLKLEAGVTDTQAGRPDTTWFKVRPVAVPSPELP